MQKTQVSWQLWNRGIVALAAALALVGAALAQPNPADQGKGVNPPNWAQGGGRGNMTPEQRQQLMAQNREQVLRRVLTAGGFPDKAVQDPIVAFANEQDKARLPLRANFLKIAQAVRGGVLKDTETATLLNDLHQSVEDEKARQESALKALDAKISYTRKPRLEALLTVLGLVGDASTYATNGGLLGGRGGGLGGGLGGGRNGGLNGGGQGGFGGGNGLGGGLGGRNGRRGGRGGFGGGAGQGGGAAGAGQGGGAADDGHV